jgi:hypothetical protein
MVLPTDNEAQPEQGGRYSALKAFSPFHIRSFIDYHFHRAQGQASEAQVMNAVANDLSQTFTKEIAVVPTTRRGFEKMWGLIWKDQRFLADLRLRLAQFRNTAYTNMISAQKEEEKKQRGLVKRIATISSNILYRSNPHGSGKKG